MEFGFVDLPEAGVILRPSGSGDSIGATLENRSDKPIAAWSLVWQYEDTNGRSHGSSFLNGVGMLPSLLLPFGLTKEQRPVLTYWNTILPGSKRHTFGGDLEGDNSDVRPPREDEQRIGGEVRLSPGASVPALDQMRHVVLVVDGVFFADGEFAGPNEWQLWEHIVCAALVYRDVGLEAAEQRSAGKDVSAVLQAVEQITGNFDLDRSPVVPAPSKRPLEELRHQARSFLSWYIANLRLQQGDERVVDVLAGWAKTRLPDYRKR